MTIAGKGNTQFKTHRSRCKKNPGNSGLRKLHVYIILVINECTHKIQRNISYITLLAFCLEFVFGSVSLSFFKIQK